MRSIRVIKNIIAGICIHKYILACVHIINKLSYVHNTSMYLLHVYIKEIMPGHCTVIVKSLEVHIITDANCIRQL